MMSSPSITSSSDTISTSSTRHSLLSSSRACFRSRYYSKLGITPPSSSQESLKGSTSTSSLSSLSSSLTSSVISISTSSLQRSLSADGHQQSQRPPSCLRHKRSVLHATDKNARVSFHPEVRLYRITSHEDYTDEEWDSCWIDSETLNQEKQRNTFEFQLDGAEWRKAREEDDFYPAPDGTLMHPATYFACRQHLEQQQQPHAEPPETLSITSQVDFQALLEQQHLHLRRAAFAATSSNRIAWSPPPKSRKTFWLLDLAIQSVQKGAAVAKQRQQSKFSAAVASNNSNSRRSNLHSIPWQI